MAEPIARDPETGREWHQCVNCSKVRSTGSLTSDGVFICGGCLPVETIPAEEGRTILAPAVGRARQSVPQISVPDPAPKTKRRAWHPLRRRKGRG